MIRAEERTLRMVEEAAREAASVFKPSPYTTGYNVLKRLKDSLEALDRSRESTTEPAENWPEED